MKTRFEAKFKAKVALEAFKGEKTLSQISSEYGVHPNRISIWKQKLLKEVSVVFNNENSNQNKEQEGKIENLYKSIGELKVENDWLKKKLEILG